MVYKVRNSIFENLINFPLTHSLSFLQARYSGIDVALKQIKNTLNQVKEFEHEVAMLRGLRHPSAFLFLHLVASTIFTHSYACADIVLFMGYSKHGEDLYLVQEYISGGSLHKILTQPNIELPWRTRVRMALDVASALLYLHNKKCLHRVRAIDF